MIGLDTNILVRYITQDDPRQSAKASRLIESLTTDAPGFIGIVSVVELVWVLGSCYDASKVEICGLLETLLRTKELVVADAEIVWKALRLFKDSKADFSDCLITKFAAAAGCEYTATFDQGAVKNCAMRMVV